MSDKSPSQLDTFKAALSQTLFALESIMLHGSNLSPAALKELQAYATRARLVLDKDGNL